MKYHEQYGYKNDEGFGWAGSVYGLVYEIENFKLCLAEIKKSEDKLDEYGELEEVKTREEYTLQELYKELKSTDRRIRALIGSMQHG